MQTQIDTGEEWQDFAPRPLVVAFSGKKGSGKDTLADYCMAQLAQRGMRSEKLGFATELKRQVHVLFGIPYEVLYADDAVKSSIITEIRWEDMPFVTEQRGRMSAREVMQIWGTEIVRTICGNAWARAFATQVRLSKAPIIFCTDCRFVNEVEAVHALSGKVVRLTRRMQNHDGHASETSLDPERFDWKRFDHVIDNRILTLEETLEDAFMFVEHTLLSCSKAL